MTAAHQSFRGALVASSKKLFTFALSAGTKSVLDPFDFLRSAGTNVHFGAYNSRATGGESTGENALPSAEYYLKQAQLAARLALTESDPVKARALHVLALEYFDKADKAKVEQARDKAG